MTTYKITKTFTAGLLKGLTITEETTATWTAGQTVDKPIGGSPYRIDAVEVLYDPDGPTAYINRYGNLLGYRQK